MTAMQLPHLNSNGTRKDHLIEALLNAASALRGAHKALVAAAPHGRDYPPAALPIAVAEHNERLAAVDSVRRDIEDLAIAIDDMR